MNFVRQMVANWGWTFPKQPALYFILGGDIFYLISEQLGSGLGGEEIKVSVIALVTAFLTRGKVTPAS